MTQAQEECDHEYETIEDSFSHEFGTEIIVFRRCIHCEHTTNMEDDDDHYI